MSVYRPSEDEPTRCRARREYEDSLLNSRSSLFLAVNGLGAIAVGLVDELAARVTIAVVVTLLNGFWLLCGFQSWKVIKGLTIKYRNMNNEDRIEEFVHETLGKRYWIRPTNIMALWIPFLVLLSWILGFIVTAIW